MSVRARMPRQTDSEGRVKCSIMIYLIVLCQHLLLSLLVKETTRPVVIITKKSVSM